MNRMTLHAACLAAIAFTAAVTANAAETATPVPLAQLLAAAQVAVDTCKAHGYAVTVTVVDADLSTRLVLRGEGAPSETVDFSRRKAYTVVKTGMSSGQFGKTVPKATLAAPNSGALPGAVNGDPNLITWAGGLPIRVRGALVGAMSASGAPGGEKDEACVIAGLAKIAGAATP
jgi:uncharacterized protein GlcG (DUF336 family)